MRTSTGRSVVATECQRQHTAVMSESRRMLLAWALLAAGGLLVPAAARADEIRLKDGKKLYGVIVAYEDNMFKVKTDFGFVLVEKDKIAAIIPAAPAKAEAGNGDAARTQSSANRAEAGKVEAPAKKADAVNAEAPPVKKPDSTVADVRPQKPDVVKTEPPSPTKPTARKPDAAKTPSGPPDSTTNAVKTTSVSTAAPSANPTNVSAGFTAKGAAALPNGAPSAGAAPKAAAPPVNREAVEGNSYVNYTYGFRMYKAPSWRVIDDARQTIPNAVVAMGTADESTLMVVAEEKFAKALEPAAAEVENRLRETYGNYRHISQRKTVAGGLPAVEIRYRGIADDHDWSGTLVVVARSSDTLSILGMTYSTSDLIQIQENVIARAIASLEFRAK